MAPLIHLHQAPPLHSAPHSYTPQQQEEQRAAAMAFVLAALAAQAFVGVVDARATPMEKTSQGEDVKKPDCVPGVDPHTFPGIGGGITPMPSHGGTSPSHGGGGYLPTPAHGHGGSSGVPALPSPSHGGGGYGGGSPSHGSSPSTGGGAYGGSSPPSTPGGGAYGSPSPSGGAYGGSSPTPAFGDSSPSHDGTSTPTTSSPSPKLPPLTDDAHVTMVNLSLTTTMQSHPMEVLSALGGQLPSSMSSSMSHFFGGAAGSLGGGGVSIQDALANTRTDGAGALLREGAAALLNSMTRAGSFPYTTEQVRDAFAAAAASGSDGAAAAQAAAFKKANEAGKAEEGHARSPSQLASVSSIRSYYVLRKTW
ncbi:hypothetical protein HU200_055896 [Digitaria exilis]|uniref:Uncharacterized protein n=1 Tax=Digitaria exilis TaxID=1010633 RepID=A0A835E6Q5_9POAL|nr:hypothetical protein HU200_055896 [Digitaria exilis]